jgi:hypothetical protein
MSRSVIRSRRGSAAGPQSASSGIALASTPGISLRPIAIPTSADVTLFETDCIVCSRVVL